MIGMYIFHGVFWCSPKQVGPDHVKVLPDKHSSDQGIYTLHNVVYTDFSSIHSHSSSVFHYVLHETSIGMLSSGMASLGFSASIDNAHLHMVYHLRVCGNTHSIRTLPHHLPSATREAGAGAGAALADHVYIIYGQSPQSCHVRVRLEPGLIVQSWSTVDILKNGDSRWDTPATILRPGSTTLVLALGLGLAFHSGCWFKGYSHGGAPRLKITVEKGAYCSSVSVGLPARFWPRRQETELCEIKAQPYLLPRRIFYWCSCGYWVS